MELDGWVTIHTHGNVWEWCLDAAEREGIAVKRDTYVDGVVDPLCKEALGAMGKGAASRGSTTD